MWARRCAPEASQAALAGAEGTRPLLPAPRLRFGSAPRLPRARQAPRLCGAGAGPGAVGTPAGPQVRGRAWCGAAAAHQGPQLRLAAPRSARRALGAGRDEESRSPHRPRRQRRGRGGAGLGLAHQQGCGRLVLLTRFPCRTLPEAEWPRTLAARSPVRPACSR